MRGPRSDAVAVLLAGLASLAGCGEGAPAAAPTTTSVVATATTGDPSDHGGHAPLEPAPTPTGDPARHERGDRGSVFLAASDQTSDGTTLVVDEVVLAGGPGWVVVHAQQSGGLGPVIGASEHKLGPGRTENVKAVLTRPLVATEATVYFMMHQDTDGNDTFDYPRADYPTTLPAGDAVVVAARVHIS